MASAIIIPIIIVSILGLSGYLVYKFVLFDAICKSNVKKILQKYNIQKTPSQIIREFHEMSGESISEKEIQNLEKHYRQTDPDQFLSMYDEIREKTKRA